MATYQEIKQRLAEVYHETLKAVMEGKYTTADGTTVTFDDDREMRENSRFYSREFTVNDIPAYDTPTDIKVINTDSVSAGEQLMNDGYRPIVLNFANQNIAGGGVLSGCRAQEESLFRQTNLFRSLYQYTPFAKQIGVEQSPQQYPMDDNFGGIYTPYATVFRKGDREGNSFLAHPFKLSFVAVAAINNPMLDGPEHIAPGDVALTKNKMRTILRIGIIHGHDAIVLGAFGCGAFKNPPRHVAQLFKEVINESEFKNKYRKIVFAVIENHHSGEAFNPKGNLKPFMDVFGDSSKA